MGNSIDALSEQSKTTFLQWIQRSGLTEAQIYHDILDTSQEDSPIVLSSDANESTIQPHLANHRSLTDRAENFGAGFVFDSILVTPKQPLIVKSPDGCPVKIICANWTMHPQAKFIVDAPLEIAVSHLVSNVTKESVSTEAPSIVLTGSDGYRGTRGSDGSQGNPGSDGSNGGNGGDAYNITFYVDTIDGLFVVLAGGGNGGNGGDGGNGGSGNPGGNGGNGGNGGDSGDGSDVQILYRNLAPGSSLQVINYGTAGLGGRGGVGGSGQPVGVPGRDGSPGQLGRSSKVIFQPGLKVDFTSH